MMENNQQLRALFALPPMPSSAGTALFIPELPPSQAVTGDGEIDAVLWLQSVVKTGNQVLIDMALESVKRITTPMKLLEDRYAAHVRKTHPDNVFAVLFATMDFGDLEKRAKQAVEKEARKREALSRFGSVEALFAATPAEAACGKALRGLKRKNGFYDSRQARSRFERHPALVPATIDDCLYVFEYWERLYVLRSAAVDYAGDPLQETSEHDSYCFAKMSDVHPRSGAEAIRAFDHMNSCDRLGWSHGPEVLRNLIASGWAGTGKEAA